MTEFIFVRHCEARHNCTPELIGGRSNHSPATARGKRQARLLGEYLRAADEQFDAVYTSGALRADTTALKCIEAANYAMTPMVDTRLQEISQGSFEGRPRIEVYTPDMVEKYQLGTMTGKLPGSESVADGAQRMHEFVADIHERTPGARLLVVSHGLAIRSLIGTLEGMTAWEIIRGRMPNVSLSRVVYDGVAPLVDYVGKVVITE